MLTGMLNPKQTNKTFSPGKVLAHAFFPYGEYDFGPGVNYDLAGDVHMDDDEEWTVGTTRGINVGILFGHELGHALGLKHSNVTGWSL